MLATLTISECSTCSLLLAPHRGRDGIVRSVLFEMSNLQSELSGVFRRQMALLEGIDILSR